MWQLELDQVEHTEEPRERSMGRIARLGEVVTPRER
jgi:hypothetical protein